MRSPHVIISRAIAVNRQCAVLLVLLFLLLGPRMCIPALAGGDEHPTLALGSAAPDFCLPGVDGQTHCLKEYAASKVLMIAFICNHCPTSQLYETRIKQIAEDYKDKGVAVVAIEPNNPDAFYTMSVNYWNEAYKNARLTDSVKQSYVQKGMENVDQALKLKADYVEAMIYKGLLLRLQALFEKEGVEIRLYTVIYEAINEMREAMEGLLAGALAGAGNRNAN